jgi:hypothetical protein
MPRMTRRLLWVLWPAFLGSCALELLVFAFFDPNELQWSGRDLGWSRQAVYTAAFFAFWLVNAGACALTVALRHLPADRNDGAA